MSERIERWIVFDRYGDESLPFRLKENVLARAAEYGDGSRVVRLVELRDGERIVGPETETEPEPARMQTFLYVRLADEMLGIYSTIDRARDAQRRRGGTIYQIPAEVVE